MSFRSKMSEKNLSLIANSTAQYSPVNDTTFENDNTVAAEATAKPSEEVLKKNNDKPVKSSHAVEKSSQKSPEVIVKRIEKPPVKKDYANDQEIKIVINTTPEIHDLVKRFASSKKTTNGKVVSKVYEEYLEGTLDINLADHEYDEDGFIICSNEDLSKSMGLEIYESLYNSIKENLKDLSKITKHKYYINDCTTRMLKRYFEQKNFR